VPLEPIARDQIGTSADLQYQAALQLLKEKTVLAKSV
jgi:carboxyl-terminal processing protease